MRIIFDVEATGAQRNHAHPYDKRNVACNVGLYNLETKIKTIYKLEYDDEPYGEAIQAIQEQINKSTVLIGVNLKFDIAWLHRYGISIPNSTRIFDCQLAYFILTNQKNSYPSLNEMAEYYGAEPKLDIVKTEYWDRGLDTNEVPYEILCEYLEQDLVITAQVYGGIDIDISIASKEMQQLIKMSMLDLIVLQDIEENGLLVDVNKAIKKGNDLIHKINEIDTWLRKIFGVPWFNPNSGDHLSVFLYGGTLELDSKEDYIFSYKDGRTATKTRNIKVPFTSKGLFKPLEKTELAKMGFYATNEPTLTALSKTAKGEYKKVLDTILKRAKLEKLRGTYYHGYLKRIEEMGWEDNNIHSNFNQCVAQSGRLSSTKPNVQNIADEVREVFISRFK
ncbi:MAG: DNA polymerase I [candidate division WS2 bacterium]|uniref:DNA polymerase I n=1 Tax=Psychracetigena formicireducens TaxID=2986056 RepID=A0A9E2F6V0_PSYF1|nr:DNA polymerase I [Candidatus Psychracetigena formicireducens]